MRYLVSIPTITGHERTRHLVEALLEQRLQPSMALVVDNAATEMHTPLARLSQIVGRIGTTVEWRMPGKNLGVAASWNVALRRAQELGVDACVLMNDDVEIEPHTMQMLLERLFESNEIAAGPTTLPFTCFALKLPNALDEVGLFDEQFFPAYFEDDDWYWRMRCAGYADLLRVDVLDLGITWPQHSTTKSEAGPELAKAIVEGYENSRIFYEQKWGAQPGHELFTKPFDGRSARWHRRKF